MKNKFTSIILLIATVLTLSSCFASRSKYGCPATASTGKFKG